ncbi:MAG: BON domain-containing protein [Sphingobacteriales bacterium]|nr:BON domain-containing protein [Sphingobacteriales bacterium]
MSKVLSVILVAVVLCFTACKPKDADIKKAVEQKISAIAEGITVEVTDGVATLTGEFKDEAAMLAAEEAIKGIKGLKSVVNNGTVTPPPPPPVEITADDPLSIAVTDASKDFPTVKTEVKDGVVTLTGEIQKKDLIKLMQTLNSLKPKKIDNQLTVK